MASAMQITMVPMVEATFSISSGTKKAQENRTSIRAKALPRSSTFACLTRQGR